MSGTRVIILKYCNYKAQSWSSVVSIVSDYGLDNWAIDIHSLAKAKKIFSLTSVSRPVLGPTLPPVQWVRDVLSLEVKHGWDMTLTTHPRLVQRS
jgi:hypothetical protein